MSRRTIWLLALIAAASQSTAFACEDNKKPLTEREVVEGPATEQGEAVDEAETPVEATRSCSKADKQRSIELLRREHPQGYRIYLADKASFLADAWWTDCTAGSNIDNIVVALHETIHGLSNPKDGTEVGQYPLIDGRQLRYLPERGFAAPYLAARNFPKDGFWEIYMKPIPGSESSATQFATLLDELNAYTHGLHAANVLRRHPVPARQWRAGVVAMMSFVKAYVTKAAKDGRRGATWTKLQDAGVRNTLRTLFGQAEAAVEQSCQLGSDGQDAHYITYLCRNRGGALAQLLGREEKCFSRCKIGK